MKLVSVAIPNYNCEEYLDKCITHIVNQTYPNLEILICDNGSEDNSVAIIKKWAAQDSRIKVFINEQNEGLINCYNKMFFAATGDYIIIQDADDWCDITRVEKQLAIMETYNVGLCVTNSVFHSPIEPEKMRGGIPSGHINIKSIKFGEAWAPATIMFKREVLQIVKGYHHYFDRLTSYDSYFIMDILDNFGGYYLNEYLYHVWERANSDHRSIDLTETRALKKIIAQDTYKMLRQQRLDTGTDWLKENNMAAMEQYEEERLNDKNYIADKIRIMACIQIGYGNFEEARELLLAAIKKAPFFIDNYKSLGYYFRSKLAKKKTFNELAAQS